MSRPNFNAELRVMGRNRCPGGPGHNPNAFKLYCPMCIEMWGTLCYEYGLIDGGSEPVRGVAGASTEPSTVEVDGIKMTVGPIRLVPEDAVSVKPKRVIGERTIGGEYSEGEWSKGGKFVKDLKKRNIKDDVKDAIDKEGGFVDEE